MREGAPIRLHGRMAVDVGANHGLTLDYLVVWLIGNGDVWGGTGSLGSAKNDFTMATTDDNRNSEKGITNESRIGAQQNENRSNSSVRSSDLDDTTLDDTECRERAKQGRTDRATGSAEPMRKDHREDAQGRS